MNQDEKKTLLLVEDDAVISLSQKILLEKNGFRVTIANSGENAIQYVKADRNINLILMDIDLGKGIDGTIAAQRILDDQEIPVVFMSSHTEKEIVDKTDKITSYGYIVKNSSETVLLASIKMAFRLFEARMKETAKEKELQESEFFFKESQRAAKVGSYKTDFISGFWKSSEVLDNIFGIGKDYLRSIQGWIDIIHPEDRDRMVKYLNEEVIGKKQPFDMEYRIIRLNDKAERWVHGLGKVEFDEAGNIIFLTGTIQDISERKKIEINLQNNQTMLRHILDTIPQNVFWKDRNSVYLGCNKAFADAVGIDTPDDIYGKTDFDLPWPRSEAEGYRADDLSVITTRTPKRHIIEAALLSNGKHIQVDTTKIPLFNEDGSTYGILGVFEDITERKTAEEKIRINEDLYHKLFTYSPYGIVISDTESYYLDANPAMCQMLGYACEEFIGLHASDIVVQSEVPNIETALNTIRSNQDHHREWNFRRKDGSVFTAEVNATKMPDGNLLGIIRDISERKLAEEKLRESEKKFREIVSSLEEGYYSVTADGILLDHNPSYNRIIGIDADLDLKGGLTPKFWNNSEDRKNYVDELMKNGSIKNYLVEAQKITGEIIFVLLNSHLVKDEKNNLIKIEGTVTDITELKHAENKIKQQLKEKEILLREVHHRIKNNIASIEALLSMQLENIKNQEAVSALQDAISRVTSMRVLYEKLLISGEYSDIPLKNYIETLIDTILVLFPDNLKINCIKKIDDFKLSQKKLFNLGIIINELITNIMKYAFSGKDSGVININLDNNQGQAILTIQDNGKGLPENFNINSQKGFGLMLVSILTGELGGAFNIENHNGTRSVLKFDI